jgi:hypothetical protein
VNEDKKQPNWIVGKRGYWQATSHEVKELFGLKPNDAWPDEGMPKRVIQGFVCWIDAAAPYKTNKQGKQYRPFKIRAKMFCGICGDETPIGRAIQHNSVHVKNKEQFKLHLHPYDYIPTEQE